MKNANRKYVRQFSRGKNPGLGFCTFTNHRLAVLSWTAGLSGLSFAIGLWKDSHLEICLISAPCRIFCT